MSSQNFTSTHSRNANIYDVCSDTHKIGALTNSARIDGGGNDVDDDENINNDNYNESLENWASIIIAILEHRRYILNPKAFCARASTAARREPQNTYFNFVDNTNIVIKGAKLNFNIFKSSSTFKKNTCLNNIVCNIEIDSIYERVRLMAISVSILEQLYNALEKNNIDYDIIKNSVFDESTDTDGNMTKFVRYIEPPSNGIFQTQLNVNQSVIYCPDSDSPNTYRTVFANAPGTNILTEPVDANKLSSIDKFKYSIGDLAFKLERGQVINNKAKIVMRLMQITFTSALSDREYAQNQIDMASEESFGNIITM